MSNGCLKKDNILLVTQLLHLSFFMKTCQGWPESKWWWKTMCVWQGKREKQNHFSPQLGKINTYLNFLFCKGCNGKDLGRSQRNWREACLNNYLKGKKNNVKLSVQVIKYYCCHWAMISQLKLMRKIKSNSLWTNVKHKFLHTSY